MERVERSGMRDVLGFRSLFVSPLERRGTRDEGRLARIGGARPPHRPHRPPARRESGLSLVERCCLWKVSLLHQQGAE